MVPTLLFPYATPFTDQVTFTSVVPVTVAWNCVMLPAPTVALFGVTVTVILEVTTTCTSIGAEVAETGFGFVTVTGCVPTCAAVAVPVAINCVGETNVVVSGCVPKFTTDPFTNPVPVSVKLKRSPITINVGVTLVSTGTALPRVMEALPEAVVSATLVAVTVIVLGFGRIVGAK